MTEPAAVGARTPDYPPRFEWPLAHTRAGPEKLRSAGAFKWLSKTARFDYPSGRDGGETSTFDFALEGALRALGLPCQLPSGLRPTLGAQGRGQRRATLRRNGKRAPPVAAHRHTIQLINAETSDPRNNALIRLACSFE